MGSSSLDTLVHINWTSQRSLLIILLLVIGNWARPALDWFNRLQDEERLKGLIVEVRIISKSSELKEQLSLMTKM